MASCNKCHKTYTPCGRILKVLYGCLSFFIPCFLSYFFSLFVLIFFNQDWLCSSRSYYLYQSYQHQVILTSNTHLGFLIDLRVMLRKLILMFSIIIHKQFLYHIPPHHIRKLISNHVIQFNRYHTRSSVHQASTNQSVLGQDSWLSTFNQLIKIIAKCIC